MISLATRINIQLYDRLPLYNSIYNGFFKFYNGIKKWQLRKLINKRTLAAHPEQPPLFNYVEIETVNRCNSTCAFCPVNKNADPREYHKMEKALLEKIINELAAINYAGQLSLYSNNEPFLDERIEDFTEFARLKLPLAYISIFTNGTLLTLERFSKIIPFLDNLIIDNYNNQLKMNKTTQIIHNYCQKHPEFDKKVRIDFININAIRETRAGQAPNNQRKITLNTSCLLPYNQLVIRPDGKISLCCQDALGKYTLGNLNQQSILAAWHSPEYTNIRQALKQGRKALELCQYCDHLHKD
jgi:radical SAM protein with 4Fe4S-binding SPASM domain